MSIPKILHFTWKTEDVPGRMGEYLAMWRDLHPHWDVRLWTDASMGEFVAEHYPDFLAAYDAYPHPIQRADSFRYLVLNVFGGVYSDLDVEPFRPIDGLVEGVDCFVGLEPDEHIGADRRHTGVPFLLSNAFMGAVPGHAYFKALVDLLPKVADIPEVFYSTGPLLTTGIGVRLKKKDRPALVPPCLWSPHCDGGKPCTTDGKLAEMLGDCFSFVWSDRQAYVSHHWLTSWVPWDKRHKWLAKPFHAFNDLKWKVRARLRPDLDRLPILTPLEIYADQTVKMPKKLPTVSIGIAAHEGVGLSAELATALSKLDYPRDRLSIAIAAFEGDEAGAADMVERVRQLKGFADVRMHFVPTPDDDPRLLPESRILVRSAALRNALFDAGDTAAWHLFIGGHVTNIPPDALKAALGAGYPVVALATVDAAGKECDPTLFRYQWGGGIRVGWKIIGPDGVASAARGQRDGIVKQRAFRVTPLDGVGRGFVLVRRDVLEAGVRFAVTPFARHLDGEGFALEARGKGFEVAGLTETAVTGAL